MKPRIHCRPGPAATHFEVVGRIQHAGGQLRWLSWVVVPEDTLLYVVARDITSERETALGLAEETALVARNGQ